VVASLHDPYMPISGPSLSSLPHIHRIVTKLLHHQCLVSSVLLFCGSLVLVDIYLDVFLRSTKFYLKEVKSLLLSQAADQVQEY
jgi:hypothetical protein